MTRVLEVEGALGKLPSLCQLSSFSFVDVCGILSSVDDTFVTDSFVHDMCLPA